MANVIVVGAGVIGVTSAFMLARRGHKVTLVERHEAPCTQTSMRNGAQLSYSFCDALGSPSLLRQMPKMLLGRDRGFRVRVPLDPEFFVWSAQFLAQCSSSAYLKNTKRLLEMSVRSQRVLGALLKLYEFEFDYQVAGKMVLLPTQKSLEPAREMMALRNQFSIDQQLINRDEATALEPVLARYQGEIAGVLYSPEDAVGSPSQLCGQLIDIGRDQFGLQTRFGVTAKSIKVSKGQTAGLELLGGETLACDRLVVATGPFHFAGTDLGLPYGAVWPVQGYSLNVPVPSPAFQNSITDLKRKMVFTRLGNNLRIAGTAEIGSRNIKFDQARFIRFVDDAESAFGLNFEKDTSSLQPWTGGRPCTPSSVPIIGPTKIKGVFANYGHGSLGWTLSFGSADLLCDYLTQN